MKAAFMRADSPAMRTSAARARAKPPPHAAPWTAAMMGCGARRISITISLIVRWARRPSGTEARPAPGSAAWAFRSRPAQKARPAPRMTTTRVSASSASPHQDGERLVAAVVVLDLPGLEVVEQASAAGRVGFPYLPGLFGFREAPIVLRACARLRARPDVLVCDGQGIAHPRRFGLACHLGYCLDLPTIGCAKRRLAGEHGPLGARRGSWAWLRDGDERLGVVLRTRDGVRPVYVSPGWAIGFRDARALVLATSAGYRLPEPTRRANLLVNALRRGEPTPPPAPPGPASGRAAPASGP